MSRDAGRGLSRVSHAGDCRGSAGERPAVPANPDLTGTYRRTNLSPSGVAVFQAANEPEEVDRSRSVGSDDMEFAAARGRRRPRDSMVGRLVPRRSPRSPRLRNRSRTDTQSLSRPRTRGRVRRLVGRSSPTRRKILLRARSVIDTAARSSPTARATNRAHTDPRGIATSASVQSPARQRSAGPGPSILRRPLPTQSPHVGHAERACAVSTANEVHQHASSGRATRNPGTSNNMGPFVSSLLFSIARGLAADIYNPQNGGLRHDRWTL